MCSASKKINTWLLAVIFGAFYLPTVVHAEENAGLVREAGAWGALVRTNHGGPTIEDSAAERLGVFGAAAAAFVRMEFGRLNDIGFGIQPELGYSPRGADVEFEGAYLGNTRTSYLDLSVLGRLEVAAIESLALHAAAGPVLGILLSARSGDSDGSSSNSREITSKLDASLALGVGATFDITPRFALTFETRYVQGFVSIDDTGQNEIQNRAIFFSLGVAARLGQSKPASLEE